MSDTTEKIEQKSHKRRRPGPPNRRQPSKRHIENKSKVDKIKKYSLEEAVNLLKSTKNAKMDETVDIVMKLGIDPRKSERGAIHGDRE